MIKSSTVTLVNDRGYDSDHMTARDNLSVFTRDALRYVAEIVGTVAFYELFTRLTGLEVADRGQVGNHELECPAFFLAGFYQNLQDAYHEVKSLDEGDEIENVLLVAMSAQSLVEQFVQKCESNPEVMAHILISITTFFIPHTEN